MASQSENTFGTKIQNAQNLVTNLQTFAAYKPLNVTESVAEMITLINATKLANDTSANKLQSFTLMVDIRQKLYDKEDDSLKKTITPIIALIRGQYGKESKEASSINEQIKKMRGTTKVKSEKKLDEKSISTSQQSYSSVVQSFADLISSLEALTPAFNPPIDNLKIPKLKEKLEKIGQTTNEITGVFGELSQARNTRNELYKDVKKRCQRIKESVKGQFGVKSTEYALIKGLKI
jgi:glutamyl/glutaminyl-tRNA synthetase